MSKPPSSPPSYRSTVAALAVGQIISWAVLFYTFSSFVLPMQRTLGWSKPTLMGAFTLALVIWGLGSYAVGAAIDRGRGRAVMAWGSVIAAAGLAMWSRVDSVPMLYATWAVLGASMAMILYDPVFAILTRRYPTRYMQGITTLTLVGGFASTLSFPATFWLIAWLEWRGALMVMAVVMLVVVAPLNAWALRGAPASGRSEAVPAKEHHTTLDEALRAPPFWLLTAAFTLCGFAGAALWVHLMPALAAKGLSEAQALSIVVWLGPAQVFSRLVHFRFGRAMSPRTLGVWVLAGFPAAFALFALVDHRLGLLLFALLFGLVNGLLTIFRGAVVPDYFGRAQIGRIGGAMSSITLVTRAAAPLVTAWLLLALSGYRDLMLVMAALCLLALVSFVLAGPPKRRAGEALRAGGPASSDRSRASSGSA